MFSGYKCSWELEFMAETTGVGMTIIELYWQYNIDAP